MEGLVGKDSKYNCTKILTSKLASSEVNVQLLGIGTLSQVKQSSRWVGCIGPEEQRELKPYVANIAMNLRRHGILQQWKT